MCRSARVGYVRAVSYCRVFMRAARSEMHARFGRRSRGRKRRKARGGPKGTKAQFIAQNAGYSVFDIYAGHCVLRTSRLAASVASGM